MSTPTPTKARGKPRGLSEEQILQAALELLDRDGLDAFSMRRLADRLGVGTMTIYGYFRSREEILDAVVDAGGEAIARAAAEAERAGSWKARLRALMISLHERHLEHPAIVELRHRRPLLSPGALKVTEVGVRILREAGFGKREAARVYRVLFIYTFGFSAFGPGPRSADDRARSIAALSALPAATHPNLVEIAPEASETMADPTLFEHGLDALLDGFERRLELAPDRP